MPNPNVIIRPAAPADLDRLVELWEQLQYPHNTFHPNYYRMAEPDVVQRAVRAHKTELISDVDMGFFVAELDGAIVGYCLGAIHGKPPVFAPAKALHVMEVVVDTAHRQQGVFTALHEHLLAWGRSLGATQAELTVDCRNETAIAAYKRQGYETIHFKMLLDMEEEG